ncbi:MAG: hypothetical protein V4793_01545 [Paraburkholderia tropica]|uniref:hypothetical protein n=1 Tax=Burkholderia gladioli TaxID=28095 RepID=UPI0016418343|nr:hypothetical protein [Burkholderia gladioli]
MQSNNQQQTVLRCKPGDWAKIIHTSNEALLGRIVKIERLYSDGRWECVLLGDAVIGLADDGEGLLLTRDWLFPDFCLEPKTVHTHPLSNSLPESFAL